MFHTCKKALGTTLLLLLLIVAMPISGQAAGLSKVSNPVAFCNSTSSIKVQWSKVKGAKKYQVYKKSPGAKSFKLVKTTSSTSWTDRSKTIKKNQYKIRAISGSKKGAYSSTVTTRYTDFLKNGSLFSSHKITFKKIKNARDLGGYVGAKGKKIKMKKILRTGSLHEATTADRKKLKDTYHLSLIFDLRRSSDVKKESDRSVTNAQNKHISLFSSKYKVALGELKINKTSDNDSNNIQYSKYAPYRDYFTSQYHYLFTSDYAKEKFKQMFDEILANNGKTILFHCKSGKDRTGVASALMLAALGCKDDVIIKDFALSNTAYIDRLSRILNKGYKKKLSNPRMLALQCHYGVSKELFVKEIDAVNEEYGSLENYLIEYIGLSQKDIKTLRKYYLAD